MSKISGLKWVLLVMVLAISTRAAPGFAQTNPIEDLLGKLFPQVGKQETRKGPRQIGSLGGAILIGPEAEKRLETAIRKYEHIVQSGGWVSIPAGPPLKIGDTDLRIPNIRKHLKLVGDLNKSSNLSSEIFDESLSRAVERFQNRHGLKVNGMFNLQTLQAMNVTAKIRLKQLRLNLERTQSSLVFLQDGRFVFVNIPSFELQAVNAGKVEVASRVIVGRIDRKTPLFSAQIIGVDFLPPWRVPENIATKDLMPKLRNDPAYFTRENFRILNASNGEEITPQSIDWSDSNINKYRFVQNPGANNALGIVRFNMPNKDIVYLHDTPLKKLFSQVSRRFSSGCVRVENIMELSRWILSAEIGWREAQIVETLRAGKTKSVKLGNPLPVHLAYFTSWVEQDGDVNFREDIYGLDLVGEQASQYIQRKLPTQSLAP